MKKKIVLKLKKSEVGWFICTFGRGICDESCKIQLKYWESKLAEMAQVAELYLISQSVIAHAPVYGSCAGVRARIFMKILLVVK